MTVNQGLAEGSDVGARIRSWRTLRKLSQMELAARADISSRHLSFIETGRGKASAATLLALASAMEMPLHERNRLLLAAGFAPRFEDAPITDAKLVEIRNLVTLILDSHNPFPAYAVDQSWQIVAANQAHRAMVAMLLSPEDRKLVGDRNIMRMVFHPRGLKNHIVNWPQLSFYLAHALKRQSLAYPSDAALAEMLAELADWVDIDQPAQDIPPLSAPMYAVPMIVRMGQKQVSLVTTMLKFAAPLFAAVEGLTIETFYPADSESRAFLQSLISAAD